MIREKKSFINKFFNKQVLYRGARGFKISATTALIVGAILGFFQAENFIHIPYIPFENFLPDTEMQFFKEVVKEQVVVFISVFVFYFFIVFLTVIIIYSTFFGKERNEEIHKKGALIVEPKKLKKIINQELKEKHDMPYLYLSNQKIPIGYAEVSKNIFAVGTTGAGKTRAIFDITEQALKKKNANAIIYDRKPDYYERYYRDGKDYLFMPNDQRSIKWGIFREILDEETGKVDMQLIKYLANSQLPADESKGGNEAYFARKAAGLLTAVYVKLAYMPKPSNKLLIDFLQANSKGINLRNALLYDKNVKKHGLTAAVDTALTVNQGSLDNHANSVMGSFEKAIKGICLEEFYTTYEEENFSIKKFIKEIDRGDGKRLFIVNTADSEGSYSMYFATFLSFFFRYSRSIKQSKTRKTLLVFDEIASLGEGNKDLGANIIRRINQFLGESRSYGYITIVGTQSLSQFEDIVDKKVMRTLFQNLNIKILMQYTEAEGLKFFTDILDAEVEEVKESYSATTSATDTSKDRVQKQTNFREKKLLLASEFVNLKDLHAYLMITGKPLAKVKFKYIDPKTITKRFIERELPSFDIPTIEKIERYYMRKAKEEQIREALRAKQEAKELTQKLAAESMK